MEDRRLYENRVTGQVGIVRSSLLHKQGLEFHPILARRWRWEECHARDLHPLSRVLTDEEYAVARAMGLTVEMSAPEPTAQYKESWLLFIVRTIRSSIGVALLSVALIALIAMVADKATGRFGIEFLCDVGTACMLAGAACWCVVGFFCHGFSRRKHLPARRKP